MLKYENVNKQVPVPLFPFFSEETYNKYSDWIKTFEEKKLTKPRSSKKESKPDGTTEVFTIKGKRDIRHWKPSSLSGREQQLYLSWFKRYNNVNVSELTEEEVIERRHFQDLTQRVLAENEIFQDILKTVTLENPKHYKYIRSCTICYYQNKSQASTTQAKTYPQFYHDDLRIPLSVKTAQPMLLKHQATLLRQKYRPQLHIPQVSALIKPCLEPLLPSLTTELTQQSNNTKICSEDKQCLDFATKNNCNFVLCLKSFSCLINNCAPSFSHSWTIPVVVKTIIREDGTTQKVIFLDKPLMNKNLTGRKKNEMFFKSIFKAYLETVGEIRDARKTDKVDLREDDISNIETFGFFDCKTIPTKSVKNEIKHSGKDSFKPIQFVKQKDIQADIKIDEFLNKKEKKCESRGMDKGTMDQGEEMKITEKEILDNGLVSDCRNQMKVTDEGVVSSVQQVNDVVISSSDVVSDTTNGNSDIQNTMDVPMASCKIDNVVDDTPDEGNKSRTTGDEKVIDSTSQVPVAHKPETKCEGDSDVEGMLLGDKTKIQTEMLTDSIVSTTVKIKGKRGRPRKFPNNNSKEIKEEKASKHQKTEDSNTSAEELNDGKNQDDSKESSKSRHFLRSSSLSDYVSGDETLKNSLGEDISAQKAKEINVTKDPKDTVQVMGIQKSVNSIITSSTSMNTDLQSSLSVTTNYETNKVDNNVDQTESDSYLCQNLRRSRRSNFGKKRNSQTECNKNDVEVLLSTGDDGCNNSEKKMEDNDIVRDNDIVTDKDSGGVCNEIKQERDNSEDIESSTREVVTQDTNDTTTQIQIPVRLKSHTGIDTEECKQLNLRVGDTSDGAEECKHLNLRVGDTGNDTEECKQLNVRVGDTSDGAEECKHLNLRVGDTDNDTEECKQPNVRVGDTSSDDEKDLVIDLPDEIEHKIVTRSRTNASDISDVSAFQSGCTKSIHSVSSPNLTKMMEDEISPIRRNSLRILEKTKASFSDEQSPVGDKATTFMTRASSIDDVNMNIDNSMSYTECIASPDKSELSAPESPPPTACDVSETLTIIPVIPLSNMTCDTSIDFLPGEPQDSQNIFDLLEETANIKDITNRVMDPESEKENELLVVNTAIDEPGCSGLGVSTLDSIMNLQKETFKHTVNKVTAQPGRPPHKVAAKSGGLKTYETWNLGDKLLLLRFTEHGKLQDRANKEVDVNVRVKMEYHSTYGLEQTTHSEAIEAWITSLIRPGKMLLKGRLDVFTAKLLLIDQVPMSHLHPPASLQCELLQRTYNLLTSLESLSDGTYMLGHNSGDDFSWLRKGQIVKGSKKCGFFDIHSIDMRPEDSDVSWIPLDSSLILPEYYNSQCIPATFSPKTFHHHFNTHKSKKKKKRKNRSH